MERPAERHLPVMAEEVVELLMSGGAERIVDCTVGYGGHSELILKRSGKAVLLGIDRDGEALRWTSARLAFAAGRFNLARGGFSRMEEFCQGIGWQQADGILMDLGVSSPQIDDPGRGFAHRLDGPLDMRMDVDSGMTACKYVNTADVWELARVFRDFGEIKGAGRLARALDARRKVQPWSGTRELAEFCDSTLPRPRKNGPSMATLCFQALRIAVNGEMEELDAALDAAMRLLAPGGRLVALSYHSLEDRRVKLRMRSEAAGCACPRGLPMCVCGLLPTLRLLTRKPMTPGDAELAANPRSRSAKLRAAEKIGN